MHTSTDYFEIHTLLCGWNVCRGVWISSGIATNQFTIEHLLFFNPTSSKITMKKCWKWLWLFVCIYLLINVIACYNQVKHLESLFYFAYGQFNVQQLFLQQKYPGPKEEQMINRAINWLSVPYRLTKKTNKQKQMSTTIYTLMKVVIHPGT